MTLCTLGTIDYCDMGYIPIFSSYSVATQVRSTTVYNEMSVPPYFSVVTFFLQGLRVHIGQTVRSTLILLFGVIFNT